MWVCHNHAAVYVGSFWYLKSSVVRIQAHTETSVSAVMTTQWDIQCYSQQQNKSVTVPITLEPRMRFLTQLTSQQRVAQVAQEIVHLWVSALDRTAKVCLGAKQDTGAQLVRTPLMFLSHLYHCAVRGPAVGTCSKRHHKVKSEDNGITLCWHFLRFRISVQWQNMHIEFFAYACEAQN